MVCVCFGLFVLNGMFPPTPGRDPVVLGHKDKAGFNTTKYSGHRQDYSEFSFSE